MAIIRREELDVASLISSAIKSGEERSEVVIESAGRSALASTVRPPVVGFIDILRRAEPYELLSASSHAETYKKRKRKRSATK